MSYFNSTSAIWPLAAGWHGQSAAPKRPRVAPLRQWLIESRRQRAPDYSLLKT